VPKGCGLLIINPENILQLFTTRQLEILESVIKGFTNREIAETHFIEETTVKRHRQNIMNKVGICGREEMRMFVRFFGDFLKNGAKSTTN
jgi:DNA-binding NarL/FixJ family response regulator